MDLEIERYEKLVELYPTNKIYCPAKKTSMINEFDINLTRYLYIKTYNSMPPDNIWSFRTLLDFEPKENVHAIDIKIGFLKNQKLQTEVIRLKVNPSDTYDKISLELKSKGLNCKLLVNENSPIETKKQIGNTKTIYGVCL
jgi:hypothetical protein